MIKSQELTDPKSDDEMAFILLERDKFAPLAIFAWAVARMAIGKNERSDPQIVEAIECANRMAVANGGIEYGGMKFTAHEMLIIVGVNALCEAAHANSVAKGFWEGTPLPDMPVETMSSKIALMHSELSEMLEGVRKPGPDSHCPEHDSEAIELADLFIRGGDYAGARRLRLAAAIIAKMRFNATRPHKHGKAI